jgi:hypothetical protein
MCIKSEWTYCCFILGIMVCHDPYLVFLRSVAVSLCRGLVMCSLECTMPYLSKFVVQFCHSESRKWEDGHYEQTALSIRNCLSCLFTRLISWIKVWERILFFEICRMTEISYKKIKRSIFFNFVNFFNTFQRFQTWKKYAKNTSFLSKSEFEIIYLLRYGMQWRTVFFKKLVVM